MKVVLLAGGLGTRISEETHLKPKPMIEIGNKPILWHIMKIYEAHGLTEFIICCGYKGYVIKEYFANYALHMSDITIDFENGNTTIHHNKSENWKVTMVDTGLHTQTGGRLARIAKFLPDDEPLCFTYGDGLGDINISEAVEYHKSHNRCVTITGVTPPGRYGALEIAQVEGLNIVRSFKEKPLGDGNRVNGGFFVMDKSALQYIDGDTCSWEADALEEIALNQQLAVYHHDGFWQPMDTLRERMQLEKLWETGNAPWKVWH